MSPVEERVERLEDWRINAERRAERVLGTLGELARSVERYATSIDRMGTRLESVLEERAIERAERAQMSRLRRVAGSVMTLAVAVAGVVVGRISS